jgi:hypothetical protein
LFSLCSVSSLLEERLGEREREGERDGEIMEERMQQPRRGDLQRPGERRLGRNPKDI